MESMRWKLTERKYKILKNIVLITLVVYVVFLQFLIWHTYQVNPGAFSYNPRTDPEPPFIKIRHLINYIVWSGFFAVIGLYIWEMKTNKKHWGWKAIKKFEKLSEKMEDDDELGDDVNKKQEKPAR